MNHREKTVAFVVVRLSSSRLAAKQLRTIGTRRLLDWTLDHLAESRELDQVVLATVAEPANEPLRAVAREKGIPLFWYEGEVDHVTTRLRCAAEAFDAQICLLISGDCPLVHGPAVDALVKQFRDQPRAQVAEILPSEGERTALTEGVGLFRRAAWVEGDRLSDRPELKEHHFPVVWQLPDLFPVGQLQAPEEVCGPHHRLSVDTPADLEFMQTVHDRLQDQKRPFTLPEVIRLLDAMPQLRELNDHVHQRRIDETATRVLLALDAGEGFGAGHLMRSQELGRQLVDRLGWPVTFLVDDPQAWDLLHAHGGSVRWGAFGRDSRPAPPGLEASRADQIPADLVVLDLYPRPLPEAWRAQLPTASRVVALDTAQPWSRDCDLVVIPGVTLPPPQPGPPPVLGGKDYLIMRQGIRRTAQPHAEKTLDLLAYLPDAQRAELLRQAAAELKLSLHLVTGGDPTFPALLAGARFFLGNFGASFYEALYLGCCPLAWPLTERHAQEARRFYRAFELPELLVENDDPYALLRPLSAGSDPCLPAVADGTPKLVSLLKSLIDEGGTDV